MNSSKDRLRCLLTGATGFLGTYLDRELRTVFDTVRLGRSQGDVICDLSARPPILPPVDIVIHAAGLAHVMGKDSRRGDHFLAHNVRATENLLHAIEQIESVNHLVLISSVSVYGVEHGREIEESHPLRPITPYGESKVRTEEVIKSWADKHGRSLMILRLPLIVGDNPPGNLGKMVNAVRFGRFRKIGNGSARKSMVLATDIAASLPHWVGKSGIYNLTDGQHPSFSELEAKICNDLQRRPAMGIPESLFRFAASLGDRLGDWCPINSNLYRKMTCDLTFCDSKARHEIDWSPKPVLEAHIDW